MYYFSPMKEAWQNQSIWDTFYLFDSQASSGRGTVNCYLSLTTHDLASSLTMFWTICFRGSAKKELKTFRLSMVVHLWYLRSTEEAKVNCESKAILCYKTRLSLAKQMLGVGLCGRMLVINTWPYSLVTSTTKKIFEAICMKWMHLPCESIYTEMLQTERNERVVSLSVFTWWSSSSNIMRFRGRSLGK